MTPDLMCDMCNSWIDAEVYFYLDFVVCPNCSRVLREVTIRNHKEGEGRHMTWQPDPAADVETSRTADGR